MYRLNGKRSWAVLLTAAIAVGAAGCTGKGVREQETKEAAPAAGRRHGGQNL